MVYTVTLNPSVDYIVHVENYKSGEVNRTSSESVRAGGKGINVSAVLNSLNCPNIALGFSGGFTGDKLLELLDEMDIKSDFIKLSKGDTRINIKIKADEETDINGRGAEVSKEDMNKLFEKLKNISDGDFLILSGSIPPNVKSSIYSDIMEMLSDKDIYVVADTTGNTLVNSLKYRPFLVKPNNFELGEIFDKKLYEYEDVIPCAKELQKMGARNVLVSMAEKGAVMVCENGEILKSAPPKGTPVNSTGAGDSMVAGFIAKYIETKSYEEAFFMGLCAGSASTFSETLATGDEIIKLYNQMK